MTFDLAASRPVAREVDLACGLVATLRPWSGPLECAAEAAVAEEARRFLASPSPELWGFAAAPGELADPVLFARLWELIETATRASLRIERLNLTLEDGEPFPLTRYALARLFHRGVDGDGASHLNAYREVDRAL